MKNKLSKMERSLLRWLIILIVILLAYGVLVLLEGAQQHLHSPRLEGPMLASLPRW